MQHRSCIAGILRIVTVGSIRDHDIACMIFSPYLKTNAGPYAPPDTIALFYISSHVEPGTAILGACMVTYRPLSACLHPRLPSFMSCGKPSSFGRKVWSVSQRSNSSSNEIERRTDLEGGTHNDNDPLEQVELDLNSCTVRKDRYSPRSQQKRQDSEGAIEQNCTATSADRETGHV